MSDTETSNTPPAAGSFNLETFLVEVGNITVEGQTADQVQAQVKTLLQPLADKITADETTLANIQTTVTELQGEEGDTDEGLQALADHLANVAPTPTPASGS